MQLYWIRAQAPRRALAFAKHVGADVEPVEMKAGAMGTPEYLSLNPNGKAPTLVDGDTVLHEASAIMAYLAVKAGSDAWPADDPAGQVQVLKWLSWTDDHWNPAVGPWYFEFVVKKTFGIGPPDRSALADAAGPLEHYAGILDDHLASHDWIALDRLTIADFQAASMAAYWRVAEMPLAPFGHVTGWLDRLAELPAWRSPWPHGRDMGTEPDAAEAEEATA